MSRIYVETYGCSASQSDAEMIAGMLKKADFNIVENEKQADLIVLVTCYVKNSTEQKILFRIRQLSSKKLIIAGCMPEGIYSNIRNIAPEASLVSTHHVKSIVEAVEKTLQGKRVEFLGKSEEVKLCLSRVRKNPIIGIVPISSGCNSACSYCCVRLAKGKLFSFPKDMIIREIESSLKEGCKEIWLTAQDTASYGLDRGERLNELLKEITELPGEFFVRVGMMNVKNVIPISSDLINAFQSTKVYKFVHLPIQSGSDDVLSSMNRGYTVSEFNKVVEDFKRLNCQIWTDVIVGYPTEEEMDFEETLNIIKKIKPDWVNVSKFGQRPGAVKLKPLAPSIVNERSKVMSELVREVSLEKNKEWIGWKGDILVSERGKNKDQWIGRNFAYKPVLISSCESLLGKILNVKVEKAAHSHLEGIVD